MVQKNYFRYIVMVIVKMKKSKTYLFNKYLSKYEISDEKLKVLKEKTLEILSDFHELCVKYNIRYTITYGSLLGAIRHGGFIPWDDDIDVYIMYQDREKLKFAITNEYKDKYHLYDWETDKNYPSLYSKLILQGTKLTEITKENLDNGISIDVFYLSYKPKMFKLKKVFVKFCKAAESLSFDYKNKSAILIKESTNCLELRKYYRKRRIFGLFFSIIPISLWIKIHRKLVLSSKYEEDYLIEIYANNFSCRKEEFFDTRLFDFESIKVYGFKNYKSILTSLYGSDFMKLPNIDERYKHIILDIKF